MSQPGPVPTSEFQVTGWTSFFIWYLMLRFMGLQRVRHDWVTELNWTENIYLKTCLTRLPEAQSALLHPEIPQRVLKVNSFDSEGFSLCRGR